VSAYRPTDGAAVALLLAVLLGTLAAGLAITRLPSVRAARWLAWALAVGAMLAADAACADQPAGVRMLVICLALLFGMKAVVGVACRAAGERLPAAGRWLAFAALWVGMRPGIFAGHGDKPPAGAGRLVIRGCGWALAGASCLALARWVAEEEAPLRPTQLVVLTALLLPGLCMLLHFGLLSIVAGWWRWLGVDARPLMRSPLAALNLGDFWGKRWNLPFVEMTTQAVFRPLAARIGHGGALLAGFLASGVLHDLAISVPVRAGYGLPTLYFTLHGLLVLAERRWRAFLPQAGVAARLWTLGWLVVPLPLLFHPWFLRGTVWPLAQ